MGLIDEVLKADAPMFVDPDIAFGESITYTRRSNGTDYTFNALVIRHSPEDRSRNDSLPYMDIYLVNDATWTKGPGSLDSGGDTITVAYRVGGSSEAQGYTVPLDQDQGMWHIEIR